MGTIPGTPQILASVDQGNSRFSPSELRASKKGQKGPTRPPSCIFPPYHSIMAKELKMTSSMISFRGNSRKVTEVRTVVTQSVSEETPGSLLTC